MGSHLYEAKYNKFKKLCVKMIPRKCITLALTNKILPMHQRIPGFDLARAYAIFGMFIVNFNFSFGAFGSPSATGRFLNLFIGNSTAIFIICAGMGLSLMISGSENKLNEEKKKYRSVILKRSWFLFGLGLLLYNWWPGDILHFYGGYMHIAAFLLFADNKKLLLIALAAIAAFHILHFLIPIQTGWDPLTRYVDFWTVQGFLRNTFYNGWNSIFPWLAYFLLGMWLGRLNWKDGALRRKIFVAALVCFLLFQAVRWFAVYRQFNREVMDYIMCDYFPPYLPFMILTSSFALMVITACIWLGDKFNGALPVKWLADTGKMTLTLYVLHVTLGMLLLEAISGRQYTGFLQTQHPVDPFHILVYAALFFIASLAFSALWTKYFGRGPLEILMRKFSDSPPLRKSVTLSNNNKGKSLRF